ncbi:MAG: hypothetical protein FJ100_21520 [Deltaproteobacteria bacterium]|nr:hypothetical protein [Deltaproteobacteria bacterium]
MKKIMLVAAAFLLRSVPVQGQIPTKRVVAPAADDPAPSTFDGSRNFMGKAVKSYIGQELFVPCRDGELRSYGYRDFFAYVFPSVDAMLDASMKGDPDGNIYMKGTGNSRFSTRHDALADRSFNVTGIQVRPADKGLPEEVYLKLAAKDRKETLFFRYEDKYENAFPFVAMKFFQKQKELRVGRDFITRGRNWNGATKPMTDINTGKPIEFPPGATWKCVDVAIASCNLSMILENDKKEQVAFPIASQSADHWIVTAEAATVMAKQFGKDVWAKALAGHVAIGMAAETAEFAWGSPKSKNTTVTNGKVSEQWVYKDGRYLYFENGKVTAVQG